MKFRLLLSVASGVLVASGTAGWVMACDQEAKNTTAAVATTSKSVACTPAMAAKCTPAQAAACRAKMKGASAATADNRGSGCSHSAAIKATASGHASCAGKANAVTADYAKDGVVIMPAGSGHACGTKKVTTAAGYSCGGKNATAGRAHHADCDACADMSDCDGELKNSGAITQVVKLKNGIMYVYTAQEAGKVRAVQSAVSHRNDRLVAMAASADRAKLCSDCKVMRGAVASGKLTRELVTIEGGSMMLVTSSDRSIVNKLHAMMSHASSHEKI